MSRTVGQHYQIQVTAAHFKVGFVGVFSAITPASTIPKSLTEIPGS